MTRECDRNILPPPTRNCPNITNINHHTWASKETTNHPVLQDKNNSNQKMSTEHQEQSQNTKNQKATWSEWAKTQYNTQYESWVPWLEDLYLRYFTKDNKASYATKDTLSRTKVTNMEQVDTLQDGVHNLVAGQIGQGGLGQPVGDLLSKEGVNRMERKGKDERGGYLPDVRNVGGLLGRK